MLTATWLLPVALVPMTWDAGDIYGPVLLPKPEDRTAPEKDNTKETEPDKQEKKQEKPKEKKASIFRW